MDERTKRQWSEYRRTKHDKHQYNRAGARHQPPKEGKEMNEEKEEIKGVFGPLELIQKYEALGRAMKDLSKSWPEGGVEDERLAEYGLFLVYREPEQIHTLAIGGTISMCEIGSKAEKELRTLKVGLVKSIIPKLGSMLDGVKYSVQEDDLDATLFYPKGGDKE